MAARSRPPGRSPVGEINSLRATPKKLKKPGARKAVAKKAAAVKLVAKRAPAVTVLAGEAVSIRLGDLRQVQARAERVSTFAGGTRAAVELLGVDPAQASRRHEARRRHPWTAPGARRRGLRDGEGGAGVGVGGDDP